MSFVDDIEKLARLKENGTISEQEYEVAKANLLARYRPAGEKVRDAVDGVAEDTNLWGMFIHLSQFLGYLIPLAGLIAPIVLWQVKKNEAEIVDRHGRIVVNWIITEVILFIVCIPLCAVLIGIPLLLILLAVAIIFPIIGAVKAYSGEAWKYPCSIPFFRVDPVTLTVGSPQD